MAAPWPFSARKPSNPRDEHIDSIFGSLLQSHSFLDRLRARKSSVVHATVTPADAIWYLSMPDKVRRQHFTREEQILLRAKCELVLLDAAPNVLHRVDDSQTATRSRSCPLESIIPHDSLSPATAPSSPAGNRFGSVSGRTNVTFSDPPQTTRKPSLAKPFNPPSTYFRNPSICQSVWSESTSSSRSSAVIEDATAVTLTVKAPPSSPMPTNKTVYLKDPNAKAFLRDCFEKSKFDECLNFGFPSTPSHSTPQDMDSGLVSPTSKPLSDWLDSLSDGDDTEDPLDGSSVDDSELWTPNSVVAPSDYKAAPSPVVLRSPSNTAYFEDLMSRDMTLRMTLTKPELRATDKELYGWQDGYKEAAPKGLEVEKDPLALEDLTFSDDTTGLKGAFALNKIRKKSIKSLWTRK